MQSLLDSSWPGFILTLYVPLTEVLETLPIINSSSVHLISHLHFPQRHPIREFVAPLT